MLRCWIAWFLLNLTGLSRKVEHPLIFTRKDEGWRAVKDEEVISGSLCLSSSHRNLHSTLNNVRLSLDLA